MVYLTYNYAMLSDVYVIYNTDNKEDIRWCHAYVNVFRLQLYEPTSAFVTQLWLFNSCVVCLVVVVCCLFVCWVCFVCWGFCCCCLLCVCLFVEFVLFVFCLFFVFCFFSHPIGKKSSLKGTNIQFTWGRYTERTAVHDAIIRFNADGTFHDRNRSGRLRKTTPRENRSMRH